MNGRAASGGFGTGLAAGLNPAQAAGPGPGAGVRPAQAARLGPGVGVRPAPPRRRHGHVKPMAAGQQLCDDAAADRRSVHAYLGLGRGERQSMRATTKGAAAVLATVSLAAGGLAGAWMSTSLATAAGAATRAAGTARALSAPVPRPTGVCSRNVSGQVVNCPSPVAPGLSPTGASNHATLTRLPANLAALVDTRTWTSAGGNTYPGADAPFG